MRGFKFRVWNDMLRKMYTYEDLEKNTKDITKIKFIQGIFLPNSESNKVMQYTGINDINGKEIYEGDIVHIDFIGILEGKEFEGVVKFYDGMFVIDNEKQGYPLFDEINIKTIKGNMFENKELLEVK